MDLLSHLGLGLALKEPHVYNVAFPFRQALQMCIRDRATGDDKAIEAVKQAVSSPLLETTIEGASHVIINISGDISLIEANEAASYVQELAGDEANIIFGAMYDENAQDEASITVIATGLDEHGANASRCV